MSRRIPGGRGTKLDPFAQRESVQDRAEKAQRVLPPYFLGPLPPAGHPALAQVFDLTHLCLYAIPPVPVDVTLTSVRVPTQAVSAGSVTYVGLYVLSGDSFKLFPGSVVAVDTDTNGKNSASLQRPITIKPNQRIFLGVKAITASPTLYSVNSNLAGMTTHRMTVAATATLSDYPKIARLTPTAQSTPGIPAIQYVSTEGALLA
jgi:hypothetical protein